MSFRAFEAAGTQIERYKIKQHEVGIMGTNVLADIHIQEMVNTGRRGGFGDVLVVGGGISGIQASLDLATAGFKVFLVDKGPSIGGHMAQLDKTFPTNDCSM